MKKTALPIFFLLFLFVSFLYGANNDEEIDRVLSSAESLFKCMKEKNFPRIWTLLSAKSRDIIIDDVLKYERKMGKEYTKEAIEKDFAVESISSNNYWKSYLEKFSPDWVLEESTWKIGKIEKDRAEIIINYKKSVGPTTLKMFKENGRWMVGLRETWG